MIHSHRVLAIACLVPLAACSGRTTRVTPAPTPEATVGQFLAAVNANDLERMAQLFGDERGHVAWRNAVERQERLTIMQHMLAADSSRVLAPVEPDSAGIPSRRLLHVELKREGRWVRVPFIVAEQRTGSWLVYAIDLTPLMPAPGGRRP